MPQPPENLDFPFQLEPSKVQFHRVKPFTIPAYYPHVRPPGASQWGSPWSFLPGGAGQGGTPASFTPLQSSSFMILIPHSFAAAAIRQAIRARPITREYSIDWDSLSITCENSTSSLMAQYVLVLGYSLVIPPDPSNEISVLYTSAPDFIRPTLHLKPGKLLDGTNDYIMVVGLPDGPQIIEGSWLVDTLKANQPIKDDLPLIY